MQWVSRAGPSLICVILRPSPTPESTFSSPTSSPSNSSSQWPPCSSGPMIANAPHDAPARLIAVIEKRGEAAARIVRGARDDDEMRRFGGAGDEPFAAADHPFAVFLLGGGADHARIGAAARRRLGHGERGFHLALDHRPQPPLLLRRRADAREQQHIAVVGRRAVDRERAEHGARRFLVDRRPGDGRQRHAAEFLGRLRRPQSDFFGLLLHRRQPRQRNIFVLGEIFFIRFEREHILLDKGARAHT